jgi:beta-glucanase (GH16 family)
MPNARHLHGATLPWLRAAASAALLSCAASCAGSDPAPSGSWNPVPVFSDEFSETNPDNTSTLGQRPDPKNWGAEVGGNGWGNNELQYYTDSASNASLDGKGNLAIVARKESTGGRAYTSARLVTKGRFEQAYGKFEASIKLPTGRGIWPAFWLLGANGDTNAWPACGEIDVMEQRGQEPQVNHGSLHGPGYSGGAAITQAITYSADTPALDDVKPGFHKFTVEWDPAQIVFSVDEVPYNIVKKSALPETNPWVYDHPFYIILNIAVGGDYVGSPTSATAFPQTMLVDWVRVYQRVP